MSCDCIYLFERPFVKLYTYFHSTLYFCINEAPAQLVLAFLQLARKSSIQIPDISPSIILI